MGFEVCARLTTLLDDDPGWAFSWRVFLWMLVPRVGVDRQVKRAEAGQADGLVVVRQVFMSFCFSIVLFGVVLAVLYADSKRRPDPATALAAGLLVVAAAGQVFGRTLGAH